MRSLRKRPEQLNLPRNEVQLQPRQQQPSETKQHKAPGFKLLSSTFNCAILYRCYPSMHREKEVC